MFRMRFARWTSYCSYFIVLLAMCSAATAEKLTIERIFAAPNLSGPSLRSPHISPDGRLVAYLSGRDNDKDRLDLWAYDIARQEHRLLVDSALIEPHPHALSAEEEARRERQRTSSLSGILDYEFSSDSRYLLVPAGGDLYIYDLQAKPENAVRRLTSGGRYETDAHFSPHGAYVSFIRDQNLIVYDLATGTERPITRDGGGLSSYGTAEFIAQEEMSRTTGYWWSPDEKSIAFTKVDESPVTAVERFQIYADSVKVIQQRYPAAGAHNAIVQLFVRQLAAPADSAAVKIDLGTNPDIYLARVNWLPHSDSLAVQRQSRDQKTLTLLKADALSGKTTPLLTEAQRHLGRSARRADIPEPFTALHLGLEPHRLQTPLPVRPRRQTHPPAHQRRMGGHRRQPMRPAPSRGVDEHNGTLYFMANIESPLERHLYSISLKDPHATPRRITADTGWHDVTLSTDTKVFLDTFSTPDRPPQPHTALDRWQITRGSGRQRANTGPPVRALLVGAPAHRVRHASGRRRGNAVLPGHQAPRAEPGKRYPVVVDVYGGPGVQKVQRAWGGSGGLFRQYLAQHGYIVFTLDNRGSAGRGVSFKTAIYHHMGSVEVQDQVAGRGLPENAALCRPQAHCRVWLELRRLHGAHVHDAGAGCLRRRRRRARRSPTGTCTTPTTPSSSWARRRKTRAGYAGSSVMTYANQLRGPLLIMHGMADDNVLFTHSTTLFKKLQDLDKQFDIMTYPGSKHGLLRFAATGAHGYATIKRFLDTQLGVDATH